MIFSENSGTQKNYCVGFVLMEESERKMANLPIEQTTKYFAMFLNGMNIIAKDHSAEVVKTTGLKEALLFYFPKTSDFDPKSFVCPLKCAVSMIDCADLLNEKMNEHNLPSVKYRVSMDFGRVMLAPNDNIFGPTVNVCAKINRMANPYGVVIGSDLYHIVNHSSEFQFIPIQSGFNFGHSPEYPVYHMKKN